MPRTSAQNEAAERDGKWCLWSKYGAKEPSLVEATDVHHLAHRQPGADIPKLCISLSRQVHIGQHHMGLSPTTSELLDLMFVLYGYVLREEFPLFFGNH